MGSKHLCHVGTVWASHLMFLLSIWFCSRCWRSFPLKEASQQRPSPKSLLLSVSQKFRATFFKKQCPPLGRRKWDSVKSKFISLHPSLTLSCGINFLSPSLFVIFEQHRVSVIDSHVMRETHVFLAQSFFVYKSISPGLRSYIRQCWKVLRVHTSRWLGVTRRAVMV